MKINCPNSECVLSQDEPNSKKTVVRNGTFVRKSDSRSIRRYYCRSCKTYFSASTLHPAYRQKKRRINHPLMKLLCSGVSQRRAARILNVNPKTVVRHFRFLATQARVEHARWMAPYEKNKLRQVQFDDLETSEHTKCKPLSVSLAVEPKHRKILDFQVSSMPAKGHLAKKSRLKYGPRKDLRELGWNQMMKNLRLYVSEDAAFTSDENPFYAKHLKAHHPKATHIQVKGGRGCIAGQGELKKLHFDPLFSLNHTCAMLRANLNRLFRRTWCMTKSAQGLIDHLAIYVVYHNKVLTPTSAINGGS